MMKCKKCGAEVGQEQKFCGECGQPVEREADTVENLAVEMDLAEDNTSEPEEKSEPKINETPSEQPEKKNEESEDFWPRMTDDSYRNKLVKNARIYNIYEAAIGIICLVVALKYREYYGWKGVLSTFFGSWFLIAIPLFLVGGEKYFGMKRLKKYDSLKADASKDAAVLAMETKKAGIIRIILLFLIFIGTPNLSIQVRDAMAEMFWGSELTPGFFEPEIPRYEPDSEVDMTVVSSDDIQETEAQAQSVNFQVGETVTTGNFEVTVTNAYVLDDLGEYKKIPEGAVYVAVEYEYKNVSKQAISSWDLPNVKLVDGNDAVYDQDMDAGWYFEGYSDSKIMSDMNPGIKLKNARIFEVAIEVLNAGGMRAYVQADQEFLVDLPLTYGIAPAPNNCVLLALDYFTGEWWDLYSQRCHIVIEPIDAEHTSITVEWANGATETMRWDMTGLYDQNTGLITYKDCVQSIIQYDFAGNSSTSVQYTGGTGCIYVAEDGYLYWNDDKEQAGESCYFQKDDSNYQYTEGDTEDAYILPGSDAGYLIKEELAWMSKDLLRLARNEIYARHGRMFKAQDLQDYFNSQNWYTGVIPADEFDEGVLNQYEKANLEILKELEDGK